MLPAICACYSVQHEMSTRDKDYRPLREGKASRGSMITGIVVACLVIAAVVMVVLMAVLIHRHRRGHGPCRSCPSFGNLNDFAVVATVAVDNTGASAITGDVGGGAHVTGFPPGTATGTVYTGGTATTNAGASALALKARLETCNTTCTTGTTLSGATLEPGSYCFSSAAAITSNLTLNGLVCVGVALHITRAGKLCRNMALLFIYVRVN